MSTERGWHDDADDPTQQRYWNGEAWTRTRVALPAAQQSGPAAGWYADPDQPQTQRYWTGSEWTEQRAPLSATPTKHGSFSTVVVFGYLFAIFLPFIGFIIGLTQINRSVHGIWIVLLSTVVFFGSLALLL